MEPIDNLLEFSGYNKFIEDIKKDWRVVPVIIQPHDRFTVVLRHKTIDNMYIAKIDKNGYCDYKLYKDRLQSSYRGVRDLDVFIDITGVKIKGWEESAKIFRNNTIKKRMFDSGIVHHICEIKLAYRCGKDQQIRTVVSVKDPVSNKNIRFLLEDLEFMYPNVDKFIKGFRPKMSREVKKDMIATVVKKNAARLPHGTKVKVLEFSRINANEQYCKVSSLEGTKSYFINKKHLTIKNNDNKEYIKKEDIEQKKDKGFKIGNIGQDRLQQSRTFHEEMQTRMLEDLQSFSILEARAEDYPEPF